MTKLEKRFQEWLSRMDEKLEEFISRLPDEVSCKLDYSVESLDALEGWLLDRYICPEEALSARDLPLIDSVARYIGETFRNTTGAEWWVDPKGKVMGGWYHVVGFRCGGVPTCPLSLATASIDRRKGNMISGVWRNQVAWVAGKAGRSPLLDDSQMRKHLKVTDEEREFERWLVRMDSEIESLFALLPAKVRGRLDYSVESLDALEAWLLDRYPDGAAARAESEILVLDGVARYVGETIRKLLSGRWWFDLEGWSHNGLPQVTDFAGAAATKPVCPLALAHAAAETRCGRVFRTALRVEENTP